MRYLVEQGLYAYFSHKADEYGVYFFDPLYYEQTEPFHANLRIVTNSFGNASNKLVSHYFRLFKKEFYYQVRIDSYIEYLVWRQFDIIMFWLLLMFSSTFSKSLNTWFALARMIPKLLRASPEFWSRCWIRNMDWSSSIEELKIALLSFRWMHCLKMVTSIVSWSD